MPTTLIAQKKQTKRQTATKSATRPEKHTTRAPLPTAQQFLQRLRGSGWWETLTRAQKELAGSLFPEASGKLRPQIRR